MVKAYCIGDYEHEIQMLKGKLKAAEVDIPERVAVIMLGVLIPKLDKAIEEALKQRKG